jgi:hypothetical protein
MAQMQMLSYEGHLRQGTGPHGELGIWLGMAGPLHGHVYECASTQDSRCATNVERGLIM